MDRVRFGRALGFGARQAVKTLVAAADAATAESPVGKDAAVRAGASAGRTQTQAQVIKPAQGQGSTPEREPVSAKVVHAASRAREAQRGVRRGSRRFGEAVWRPFVRLSGVLWLEVTGVFFGIFALVALATIWRLRGDWHATAANGASHRSLLGAVAMLVVFGYFCVSSFVRARRRERGR